MMAAAAVSLYHPFQVRGPRDVLEAASAARRLGAERLWLGHSTVFDAGLAVAAVDQVVRGAALQLAHQGIRVCGVPPGLILTEIAGEHEGPIWLSQLTTSGEARRPDDMAPAYHLLASEAGAMFQDSIVAADDGTVKLRPPRSGG